jgi:hypothetical protein
VSTDPAPTARCDGWRVKLSVPVVLRGHRGMIAVRIHSSRGEVDSGAPLLGLSRPHLACKGLPVCTATVSFRGHGYVAAMGWVQLVQSSDAHNPNVYEVDPLALFRGVNTPYAFFGIKPTLFDAPYRDRTRDVSWHARSYLAITSDAVISQEALPVAAFTWGFQIRRSEVTIEPPRQLDIRSWESHAELLERNYPGWRFRP